MKHIPKYTPTEVLNDPYGFTYKEMSEVIGEDKAKALYTELYKQSPRKKNLSISDQRQFVIAFVDRWFHSGYLLMFFLCIIFTVLSP